MNHPSNDGGARGNGAGSPPPLQAALTEALGAFSKDPAGAARRVFDTAERALAGAGRRGGGRDPLAGLAAAASKFLSDVQSPVPGRRGDVPGGQPPGGDPGGPSIDARGGGGEPDSREGAAAASAPPSFVGLRQRNGDWPLHVRAAAVEAVTPVGEAGCVLHLSDGSTVEAGGCSDEAARPLPGLVRLSQAGTQSGLYVRPPAVLAVAAPPEGGCVLRLRGGRELAAAEAAAVAVGLLAGTGG